MVESESAIVDEALAALRRLTLASEGFRRDFAHSVGIRVLDTVALSHLAAGGPLLVGELARRIGIGASGATTLVDRLEQAGLVRRQTRTTNRRTVEIDLTDKGTDALATVEACTRAAIIDAGGDDLASMQQMLDALSDALTERALEFAQSG